jgi:hypothetical protein
VDGRMKLRDNIFRVVKLPTKSTAFAPKSPASIRPNLMIPHKKEINVRLSWHYIRRTAVLAYLHGMSFEEYINHKLREYIKESRET